MGSNRGGNIVTSLGPVAVVPLPPFEWKGVENINVGLTGFKPLEPSMVVSRPVISLNTDTEVNFELRLQGKKLTPKQFDGQTLNITLYDGSTTVGRMYFESDEGDGIQYYNVNYDIEANTYDQLTSFRFSPPDNAFEVSCVDIK